MRIFLEMIFSLLLPPKITNRNYLLYITGSKCQHCKHVTNCMVSLPAKTLPMFKDPFNLI